jgi:hypothetical protein
MDKLTLICSKNKEMTDESGSEVAGECDGDLSCDGHVGIIDTMTTCNQGVSQLERKQTTGPSNNISVGPLGQFFTLRGSSATSANGRGWSNMLRSEIGLFICPLKWTYAPVDQWASGPVGQFLLGNGDSNEADSQLVCCPGLAVSSCYVDIFTDQTSGLATSDPTE